MARAVDVFWPGNNFSSAGGSSVPGLHGTSGDDRTLGFLNTLDRFRGIDSGQFRQQLWYDPLEGDDVTGDGSYAKPFQTLLHMKRYCLNYAFMRCTVKGQNRTFTNRLLTVTYATNDPLMEGEAFTTTHPIAGTADDCAASCGTVLVVQGNKVVLRWADTVLTTNVWGTTPTDKQARVGTVITGARSGAVGTVTVLKSTLTGIHSLLFAAADMTVASPTVVTVNSHGHANNDGPFLWANQTTMPTTTGTVVTESVTKLYTCSVTADTFQLSSSSTCTVARVNVTGAGVGSNQLYAFNMGQTTGADDVSMVGNVLAKCGPRFQSKICILVESERPEWPWRVDMGGFYWEEIRALIEPSWWPGYDPTGGGGGNYNTPIGYLFSSGPMASPDANSGFLGIQNGIVSNVSMDCMATGTGGKIIGLNVSCIDIRGGPSDRSMTGGANPSQQAHNSMLQITGALPDATKVGGVGWWINNRGFSSSLSGSGATFSGGAMNTNESGLSRVLSTGTFYLDTVAGDTGCGGGACNNPFAVVPSGEAIFVGPAQWEMGPNQLLNRWMSSGVGQFTGIYKITAIGRKNYAVNDTTIPYFVAGPPLAAGSTTVLDMNEFTYKHAGFASFASICEAQSGGTVLAAASRIITARNLMLEGTDGAYSNLIQADCAAASCPDPNTGLGAATDCGDGDSGVLNSTILLEGAYDLDDAGTEDAFFQNISYRPLGIVVPNKVACTGGTANSMREKVCQIKTAGGKLADDFILFENRSIESGGVGVDGDQFLRNTVTDPFFNCSSSQACWLAADPTSYTVNFKPFKKIESYANEGCLPADVVGSEICSLTLQARHKGGR
jgi:hypothetical protein